MSTCGSGRDGHDRPPRHRISARTPYRGYQRAENGAEVARYARDATVSTGTSCRRCQPVESGRENATGSRGTDFDADAGSRMSTRRRRAAVMRSIIEATVSARTLYRGYQRAGGGQRWRDTPSRHVHDTNALSQMPTCRAGRGGATVLWGKTFQRECFIADVNTLRRP